VAWLEQHDPEASLGNHGAGRGVGAADLERLRVVASRPPVRAAVPRPGEMPFLDTVPNI